MPKILNCRGPVIRNDDKWIYDFLEYEAFCPNDISKIIEEAKQDNDSVILRINSPGGYVDAGAEMYEEIQSSDVHVESRIVGDCCSAATYLTCAANESTMSPLGQYMIHRCAVGGASGNANDFAGYLQSLNETDKAIAHAYSLKTGKSEDEILELMDKTTYMSSQTALDNGFIDKILFVEDNQNKSFFINTNILSKSNANGCLISDEIINQMQNNKEVIMESQSSTDFLNHEKELALSKLNLLKLGGKQ